ncbi:MAG: hypothetical protein K6V97_06485 [Actinomycetia bacterium]|nr:hypothetical protein [Actinomycetes bacterium]
MPIGNMSLRLTLATLLLIVGSTLVAIMIIERGTPGEGWIRVTSFYTLVGAAMLVVGGALLVTPF